MVKTILLIDDDNAILEATTILLESEGYNVVGISKADRIIAHVEKIKPDVILLDVLLSGKDGRDIAQELKSKPTTKNIPVILLSAYSGVDQTFTKSGANDFIPKPFEIATLLNKVKKYTK